MAKTMYNVNTKGQYHVQTNTKGKYHSQTNQLVPKIARRAILKKSHGLEDVNK